MAKTNRERLWTYQMGWRCGARGDERTPPAYADDEDFLAGYRAGLEDHDEALEAYAKTIRADKHGWEINFQPEGTKGVFHISHQVGVSAASWQYRTTPIARELVAALLNEKELYKYDGVIRSHAHYFVFVRFNAFGLITPCWQTRTPYMIRKGLSLIPKLGYVVIQHHDNEHWSVRAKTFNMPRPELTVV